MLKEEERKEEKAYLIKLIKQDKPLNKGHLSLNERDKITILLTEGYSIGKIAKILNRAKSTISRELRRKEVVLFRNKYVGSQTHINVYNNWIKTHQKKKLANKQVQQYVIDCLKIGLSPETIAGRLRTKYNFKIHHETIYKFVYEHGTELSQYLLRRKLGRKHRQRFRKTKPMKSKIPNRVDIDLRPIEANFRLEFGHFEADSIESCKTRDINGRIKTHSCLTVLVDRSTRKTIIKKTASKTSVETTKSLNNALKPYINTIKSITYDNGLEFSQHEKINKNFNIRSYFCKPYHSWEKGTVENINGIIRRFFPKKTNFDNISLKEIKYVENWINNRPMKVLNFKTPNEKYAEIIKNS